MKKMPRSNKNTGNGEKKITEPFRYTYADFSCDYCLYCKQCKAGICPHIMDSLEDLMCDGEFIRAITNAENCDTNHKQTLMRLKENLAVDV